MRKTMRRLTKKGARQRVCDATVQELLGNLWGIRASEHHFISGRADAYLDHCNSLTLIASMLDAFHDHKSIVDLVRLVQNDTSQSIASIIAAIKIASRQWAKSPFSQEQAQQALQFATRLWLFSVPHLEQPNLTLEQANRQLYQDAATSTGLLSADFSAKSLTRKGGFYIIWTSELSEHLTFASKDQLRVFRHSLILTRYQKTRESSYFPPGFLEETYRTINLLFPFEDYKTSKRVKRITRREQVDIEAAMTEKAIEEHEKFQISSYQFYGLRLAEIQRRYDLARPHRLTQWWYDRRQRPEWAALMVALVVFVLTVLFGIAQTVTGVLQVIEARH